MNALSGLYGGVARARRAWYGDPRRQRRLERPVLSVGNLVVGGSGKTPVVSALTLLLQELGERPAILSRGYGRRSREAPLVVSEGDGPRVDVAASGDEPQMLARRTPGAVVVVGANRYDAGRLAETRHGATVHVLDDGFQHVTLWRDIDLLLVSPSDLGEQVLPVGRLREPVAAAGAADAVLVPGTPADQDAVRSTLGVATVFAVTTKSRTLKRVAPFGVEASPNTRRAVAVAGIARPERFLAGLAAAGIDVVRSFVFRDHHWFNAGDRARVETAAAEAGTSLVVTTEKDAVRLEGLLPPVGESTPACEWTFLPIDAQVLPEASFRTWIADRLASARRPGRVQAP